MVQFDVDVSSVWVREEPEVVPGWSGMDDRPATPGGGLSGIGAGHAPWAPTGGVLAATLLAGCGGGGGGDSDGGGHGGNGGATDGEPGRGSASTEVDVPAAPPAPPTAAEASRFLAQASMGATRAEMERVQAMGYSAWLDDQFESPPSLSRWDWLAARGYMAETYRNGTAGLDAALWCKLLASPDTLRQRVALALSEIFVVSVLGLPDPWRSFTAAAYMDLLEAGAFGSLRDLLQDVSRSPAMGTYLTFRGNARANARTGALPDENYARELLQLFTIGLVQLQADGTVRQQEGQPLETYGAADITGLARVFTGWDHDLAGLSGAAASATPEYRRRPMVQVAGRYETGEKQFLGTTIAAGTPAPECLSQALDAIFAHANMAPFFCRQLIQRLVTSNPGAAYVERVARAFADDGNGGRGNLRAVVRAVLLDPEARAAPGMDDVLAGKLREPMLRFTAWARASGVTSPSDAWAVGDTSDPARTLGQSPMRAASVFNFFRPGGLLPGPGNDTGWLAPEFQITSESSVVGYVNFMQRAVTGGVGDLAPDYGDWMGIAASATALVDDINLVLAAGQLSAATCTLVAEAVQTVPATTEAGLRNRVCAALLLVLASPEYLVQK